MKLSALVDSNVVIAAIIGAHEHHPASLAMFPNAADLAVAAHSYAEAYSTLTRTGTRAPFELNPGQAWAALESVNAVATLVGLTPAQTFDAVRDYARIGGVGPRLYDRLIGQVAKINGISKIITWNTNHMSSLFPTIEVLTPSELAAP